MPRAADVCDHPGCSYTSLSRSNFIRHRRTHTGERPHACDAPGCAYAANDTGDLRKHKQTKHGVGREASAACLHAGCAFTGTPAALARHCKAEHAQAGAAAHACTQPGCAFSGPTRAALSRHSRQAHPASQGQGGACLDADMQALLSSLA